jgi:gp16 family phage-associated protein
MDQKQLKTREEILEDFARKGISIASWAKRHGLAPSVVHAVLKGKRQSRIGASHKAAVLLGIKEGEIVEEEPYEEGQERRSGSDRREGFERRGAA